MSSVTQATPYPRPLVRALVVGQFAGVGAFLAVLLLYLGRMASAGVGPADMVTGAYDPTDGGPDGRYWLYGLVSGL